MNCSDRIVGPYMALRAKSWRDYKNLEPEGVTCDYLEGIEKESFIEDLYDRQGRGELTLLYFVESDWPRLAHLTSRQAVEFAMAKIESAGWPVTYESMEMVWNNLAVD